MASVPSFSPVNSVPESCAGRISGYEGCQAFRTKFPFTSHHNKPVRWSHKGRHVSTPCVAFTVQHSFTVRRPKSEVLLSLLDIPGTPKYDPSTAEVEVVTPEFAQDSVGVTYKLKGIVRPLAQYFPDFVLTGYVYIKLLEYNPDASPNSPQIVREQVTTQGAGIEVFQLTDVPDGTLVKYKYDSTGYPDADFADTTPSQRWFARLDLFKLLDDYFGRLSRETVVASFKAKCMYLEQGST